MKTTLFLHLCVIFSLARAQTTISFVASKDTYINSAIPNLTQGTNNGFVASAWTYGGQFGTGHSLIGFETCELPQDFQLIEATLYLYFNPTSGHVGHTTDGLNSAKAYRITSTWNESTTWASQPTFDNNDFAILPSAITSNQDYAIDVTTIVANAFTNGSEVSFYVKLDDEQLYRSLVFAAHEHPDSTIRPRLEITYSSSEDWCETGGNDPDNPNDPDPIEEEDSTCVSNMRIPNVFTPNNDGKNDCFYITTACNYENFRVIITNRWGNPVFESDEQHFKWYGHQKLTPKEVTEGVYFYKITGRLDGQWIEKHGFIHLTR